MGNPFNALNPSNPYNSNNMSNIRNMYQMKMKKIKKMSMNIFLKIEVLFWVLSPSFKKGFQPQLQRTLIAIE